MIVKYFKAEILQGSAKGQIVTLNIAAFLGDDLEEAGVVYSEEDDYDGIPETMYIRITDYFDSKKALEKSFSEFNSGRK